MTALNRTRIGNAIIWAAMILASALLMGDSDNSFTMLLLLIGGWFCSNALLAPRRCP